MLLNCINSDLGATAGPGSANPRHYKKNIVGCAVRTTGYIQQRLVRTAHPTFADTV